MGLPDILCQLLLTLCRLRRPSCMGSQEFIVPLDMVGGAGAIGEVTIMDAQEDMEAAEPIAGIELATAT